METRVVIESIIEEIVDVEKLIQTIKEVQESYPQDEGLIFSLKQYEERKRRLDAELLKQTENIVDLLVEELIRLPDYTLERPKMLELARALRESFRRTSKTRKV